MAVFINRAILTGYLTGDPKLNRLPSGVSVCNLTIGASTPRKSKRSGQWYPKPNFFEVAVFGRQAEIVAERMRKGCHLAVDGRLDWRQWETEDGRKVQEVSIIAGTVQPMGSPPEGAGTRPRASSKRQRDAERQTRPSDASGAPGGQSPSAALSPLGMLGLEGDASDLLAGAEEIDLFGGETAA